jgi:4-hydroxybenzoate polyprenyltransferase
VWAALRVRQWAHFVALPLASLDVARLAAVDVLRVPLAMTAAACCLATAYAVNAVCERHTDRSAHKNPLVAAPQLGRRAAGLAGACAGVGLAAAAALGGWAPGAAVMSLAAGVVYSTSRFGKRTPVAGLLCNTGIFAPLLVLLHAGGPPGAACVAELGLFVALLAQNQLLHELADAAEDAGAGARTTARWLGPRGTRAALVGLGVAGVTGAMLVAPTAAGAWAGGGVALAATLLALSAGRRWHRVGAVIGGALVFVLHRAG